MSMLEGHGTRHLPAFLAAFHVMAVTRLGSIEMASWSLRGAISDTMHRYVGSTGGPSSFQAIITE
jgi:hypothetical protein